MQYASTKLSCGLLHKNLILLKIEVGVAILSVDDLKPGMVLGESVFNQQELLLLEKDTALTKRRIWILKTWGIKQVHVKGKPKEGGKTAIEIEIESRETIEKELKAKFEDVIDDPVMKEIMKAAQRQLLKSLNDQDAENKPT
jgi:hypothetical protein